MPDRRQFLVVALKSLALMAGGGALIRPGRTLAADDRWVVPGDTFPEQLIDRDPKNLDTVQLEVTPIGRFRTMGQTTGGLDVASWRLEVAGRVEKPLVMTYRELKELPVEERKVLLICPGVFAYVGLWQGVRLSSLLERAGAAGDAKEAVVTGPPGPGGTVKAYKMEEIRSGRVFLAWGVNGQNLPEKHGFPLRIVADDHYGFDWVKYVGRIEVR